MSCLEDLGILVRTQGFSEFEVLVGSNLAGCRGAAVLPRGPGHPGAWL